jgi:hypothetical protein
MPVLSTAKPNFELASALLNLAVLFEKLVDRFVAHTKYFSLGIANHQFIQTVPLGVI